MSKYDNLDLALRAKFQSLGFNKYDTTGHILDVFRDWDKRNNKIETEEEAIGTMAYGEMAE